MGRHKIEQTATTSAPPSAVYALLRDGSTWPRWSPIGAFSLTREGAEEREGLGALRLFTTGRARSCEEIVELVENRRLSYELRSGLPLVGYRADVDLEPTAGGGTTIHWRSSFDAKIPGTGWFYRMFLGAFIGRCARGLAAYAAEHGSRVSAEDAPARAGGTPAAAGDASTDAGDTPATVGDAQVSPMPGGRSLAR